MPPKSAPPANRTGCPTTRIGVGIDTSRYGHYAAFLRDDLQPAAADPSTAAPKPGSLSGRTRLFGFRHRGLPRCAAPVIRVRRAAHSFGHPW